MSDHPQTLLALAGIAPRPTPLDESVLLLIDMQREYVDGRLPLPDAAPALAATRHLLAAARASGTPILHVLQAGRAGGLFDPDGPGYAPAPEVAPRPDEPVIVKRLPSAFAGTDLAAQLEATGRRGLIIAGFMTHMCVSTTARAASELGYAVTIPAAATATRALPDTLGGAPLSAVEVQRAALAALADRFACVTPDVDALLPVKSA